MYMYTVATSSLFTAVSAANGVNKMLVYRRIAHYSDFSLIRYLRDIPVVSKWLKLHLLFTATLN